MDPAVFSAVLAAAFMHAGWNVIIKVGLDRFSSVLLLAVVQGGLALLIVPFCPVPDSEAWLFVVASAALHVGYKIFLVRAYEHGDLSQIYPLARGTAPLMVAVAGLLVLGEVVPPMRIMAVLAIALGVIIMSMKGGTDLGAIPAKALAYALGTAAFTASYTMVDGIGARLAGTAAGYTAWMFATDGLGMLAFGLATRGRAVIPRMVPAWRAGLVAGILSYASYWIAIWAFTKAPIALVAALRETSVLFAMLLGVLLLKERAGLWRWTAAGLIAGGVVLLRL